MKERNWDTIVTMMEEGKSKREISAEFIYTVCTSCYNMTRTYIDGVQRCMGSITGMECSISKQCNGSCLGSLPTPYKSFSRWRKNGKPNRQTALKAAIMIRDAINGVEK